MFISEVVYELRCLPLRMRFFCWIGLRCLIFLGATCFWKATTSAWDVDVKRRVESFDFFRSQVVRKEKFSFDFIGSPYHCKQGN